MADRIKGITVEIGGDTTGLSKALSGVNKEIRNTQSQLTDVNRLLKLDPTNSELLSQKQKLLSQAVGETKEKLTQLKSVQDQMDAGLKNGSVTQEQYDAWQREIIATEQELKGLEQQCKKTDMQTASLKPYRKLKCSCLHLPGSSLTILFSSTWRKRSRLKPGLISAPA